MILKKEVFSIKNSLVYAFISSSGINLFGIEISWIRALPFIVLILGLIVIFYLILRDRLVKLSLPKLRLGWNFETFKENLGLKHKKQTQIKITEETKGKEPDLSEKFNKKLSYFRRKFNDLRANESFIEFNNLFKEYIRDKLNIKGEFTLEEIPHSIKVRREIYLAKKISSYRYGESETSKDKIKELVKDFEDILNKKELAKEKIIRRVKLGNLQFILNIKNYFKEKELRKEKSIILKTIDRGRILVLKDMDLARTAYVNAVMQYFNSKLGYNKDIIERLNDFGYVIIGNKPEEQEFVDLFNHVIEIKKHNLESIKKKGIKISSIINQFINKKENELKSFLRHLSRKLHSNKHVIKKHLHKKMHIKHKDYHKTEKAVSKLLRNVVHKTSKDNKKIIKKPKIMHHKKKSR